jgi:hypothetical protein
MAHDFGGGFDRGRFDGGHFDQGRDYGLSGWWWDGTPDVYGGDDDTFGVEPAPTYSAQVWYYCQNPAGFYPYVTSCTSGWQPVPAG